MEKSRLCLCLTSKSLEQNIVQARKHMQNVDLVELRADFLDQKEWPHLARFPGQIGLPSILTLRRKSDGGRYGGPESDRFELLRRAAKGGFNFVDLEDDVSQPSLESNIRQKKGRIIRSIHCLSSFADLLPDLRQRMQKLQRHASDLPKAALMLESTADLVRLFDLASELAGMQKIIMGMGSFGFATRILANRLGSYLCFSSLPGSEAAAGHTDPATLNDMYRFAEIGPATKIYGVIGNPVMHSFSPMIHNPGLAAMGLDAVYLPIHVDRLEDFFALAEQLDIGGVSVTIPHKEAVIAHLNRLDSSVEATKSCNTLVKQETGWFGTNTDVQGFLAPLPAGLSSKSAKSKRATVVGAGGAARSIVYALRKAGLAVLILNRTPERAAALAKEFECAWKPLDEEGARQAGSYSDLIVQTTSLGMQPHTETDPMPWYDFGGHETLYEIVYNPPETRLLQRAKKAGCSVIYGREMLLAQALGQFKLFTGCDYPNPERIQLQL